MKIDRRKNERRDDEQHGRIRKYQDAQPRRCKGMKEKEVRDKSGTS